MNSLKRLFWWCSGTKESFDGRTSSSSIGVGVLIVILSLLFTFFISIELVEYFDHLPYKSHYKEFNQVSINQEALSADGNTPSMTQPLTLADSSNVITDLNSSHRGENEHIEGLFSAKMFFSNYSLVIGIISGVFLGVIIFMAFRLIFSWGTLFDRFQTFLWWCGGARIDILKESPSDHAKYFGIGGTVLFTALMATFAGGYAFFTAFDSIFLSILFGLFWGALIFNLDRYIVSSVGRGDGTAKITRDEFFTALPRLILAILIAFVVATPLELRVFKKEIDIEIQKIIDEKRSELARGQDYNLNEIQMIKNEIARLRNEEQRIESLFRKDPRIDLLEADKSEIQKEEAGIRKEMDPLEGTYRRYSSEADQYKTEYEQASGSGQRDQARRKMEEAERRAVRARESISKLRERLEAKRKELSLKEDEIDKIRRGRMEEYANTLDANRNTIEKLEEQLRNIQRMRRGEIVRYEEIARQYTGLMAQLDALSRLSSRVVRIYNDNQITSLPRDTSTISLDSMATSDTLDYTTEGDPPYREADIFTEKKELTPVFFAKWLITLLFICIEIAPILFKLMTESGPYDDRLEAEKHKSLVDMKKSNSEVNEATNMELALMAKKNQSRIEAEVKANKELLEYIAKAQSEVINLAIDQWKEDQIQKARENPSAFIKIKDEEKNEMT